MKKILFFTAIFVAALFAKAQQNVGIGTSTPQATLDVKGNQRIGGATHFTSFDSVGGKIEWRNANLYVPVSQYLMQHSAAADGLFYNNNAPISGQLEYRNALGNPVFYTNFINGNGYFSNRLGINNLTPQFPISLNGDLGDKISLWTDGTPTHYGMGIQSGLFQLYSKTSFDDIAFGYGSSTSFTERMRIKGDGNIGLGVADPAFRADVGGRIRIRTGTDGEAGIWLNKTDNTNIAAFMGLENDSYVGFYGGNAGWKFGMNTQTGALKINGSEGQAGQVLQSNGSGTAPAWINASGKTQYYRAAIPSVILTNASPGLEVVVPVNVAVNSIITVSVTATVSTANFVGCNVAELSISMEPTGGGGILDIAGRYKLTCGLTNHTITTGENPLALFNQTMQVFGPGANGVKLTFFKSSGPDITIGNIRPATIVVKVVPL
jgi:hypothetical protein